MLQNTSLVLETDGVRRLEESRLRNAPSLWCQFDTDAALIFQADRVCGGMQEGLGLASASSRGVNRRAVEDLRYCRNNDYRKMRVGDRPTRERDELDAQAGIDQTRSNDSRWLQPGLRFTPWILPPNEMGGDRWIDSSCCDYNRWT